MKKARRKNTGEPKNREPAVPTDKMQAILLAAQRIFTRCGFGQTRVEDIAQEAGVGKGTVYEYFPSKQAIFEQAVETGIRDYLAAIVKETEKAGPIKEKLRRIATMHLGFVAEHRNMVSVVMSNPAILLPHREKLLGICREAEETVAAVIQEGVDSGVLRPISAQLAAQALIGVLSTVGGVQLLEKHELNVETTAAALMDIVLHGIASNE